MLHVAKPRSSRNSSIEAFIVCEDYNPPEDYTPTMSNPLLDHVYGVHEDFLGANRTIVPFMACGDLNAFDSDRNYALPDDENYIPKPPTQAPIRPPYSTAVGLQKGRDTK